MGLLSDGVAWLDEIFSASEETAITYNDRAITAVVGIHDSSTDEAGFSTEETTGRDFLIRASKLIAEPKQGDVIEQSGSGKTYKYEVVAIPGDGPWRWHDPDYLTYRVHTTLTEVA
jgi:hypothetical protein